MPRRSKATRSSASRRRTPQKSRRRSTRQIGYAVVGLGHIAQAAVLPAFAHAGKNSKLVALVSDDREKLQKLGRKYKVGKNALYTYDDFDECLQQPDVDAVYIALPNHLHRDYAVRAARAGVHVLCEKPMALTSTECEEMIRACRESDVRLMIAYREHFDPATLTTVALAQSGRIGDLRVFESTFGFQVKEGNIRVDADKGGGPIWDIGIYCLNAARMLFQAEPTEVFAYSAERPEARFAEVPETVSVSMKFPDERIAQFHCSFGIDHVGSFRLYGTKGSVELQNAYSYTGKHTQLVNVGGKEKKRVFKDSDQFAPELLDFSKCVIEGREPEPNGVEGETDVRIIEAIHRSLAERRPVEIEVREEPRRAQPDQQRYAPPVEEPDLVNVQAPHQ